MYLISVKMLIVGSVNQRCYLYTTKSVFSTNFGFQFSMLLISCVR
jgi:hypothetical protein